MFLLLHAVVAGAVPIVRRSAEVEVYQHGLSALTEPRHSGFMVGEVDWTGSTMISPVSNLESSEEQSIRNDDMARQDLNNETRLLDEHFRTLDDARRNLNTETRSLDEVPLSDGQTSSGGQKCEVKTKKGGSCDGATVGTYTTREERTWRWNGGYEEDDPQSAKIGAGCAKAEFFDEGESSGYSDNLIARDIGSSGHCLSFNSDLRNDLGGLKVWPKAATPTPTSRPTPRPTPQPTPRPTTATSTTTTSTTTVTTPTTSAKKTKSRSIRSTRLFLEPIIGFIVALLFQI